MFLICGTGWTKKGLDSRSMEGGCSNANLNPLLQVMHDDFLFFFDDNVSNKKGCTYLKGCFQIIIKIGNYQTFSKIVVLPIPPFTFKSIN